MKKKGLKILVGILVVFVIIGVISFGVMYIYKKEVLDTEVTKNTSLEGQNQNIDNMVKIIDGKIENEDLIDEFINEVTKENVDTLKIRVKDNNSEKNLEIDFVPSELKKQEEISETNTTNTTVFNVPDTEEYYQKAYGYYKFSINGEEKARYNKLSWNIGRMTKENKVTLYFNNYEKPEEVLSICEYDLGSSNYKERFELNYHQRKDLGIKTIIDKNLSDKYNYNVCTFGGEVTITVEKDMMYALEDAMQQNVITVEDILSQAKMDEKYGICECGYYSDGGSTEYCYPEYTILKYNTLDGNQDLYIGMKGQIINQLNGILDGE